MRANSPRSRRSARLAPVSRPKRRASATVVIPCYRYGRYLRAAVDAAFAQRHVDMRVIIVDDASPDDSLETARRIAAADDRVRVIAHEANRGHIQTYNDGLAAVETEFVALVSADDLVAPGAFDRAVAVMQSDRRIGLTYGKVVRFADEPAAPSRRPGFWRVREGRDWIHQVAVAGWNPIISPEAILRTDVVRAVGPYNPALPHSADLEYWLRAAEVSRVAQLRGIPQAYYRVHGANMHLTTFAQRSTDLAQKRDAFEVLRRGHVDLYRTAAHALAAEALHAARKTDDAAIAADLARFAAGVAEDRAQRQDAARVLMGRGLE